MRAASWKTRIDVVAQFNDSDRVGEKTVFNMAKNRYRLVASTNFLAGIVYIKNILSHKEYDKRQWKQ